jgi:hypothetical protein
MRRGIEMKIMYGEKTREGKCKNGKNKKSPSQYCD